MTIILRKTFSFKEFRNVYHENYKFDPAWYYTAPGLAQVAAFKETDEQLELLTDMLLMIEKGIREGVSMISNNFGRANNPDIGKAYDEAKPTKCII